MSVFGHVAKALSGDIYQSFTNSARKKKGTNFLSRDQIFVLKRSDLWINSVVIALPHDKFRFWSCDFLLVTDDS